MSTTKITPRPIAELTAAMGVVLLIGESGHRATPTRCVPGYRDEDGVIRTFAGDRVTEDGPEATSFLKELPYDQEEALRIAEARRCNVEVFGEDEEIGRIRFLLEDMGESVTPEAMVQVISMLIPRSGPLSAQLQGCISAHEREEIDADEAVELIRQALPCKELLPA